MLLPPDNISRSPPVLRPASRRAPSPRALSPAFQSIGLLLLFAVPRERADAQMANATTPVASTPTPPAAAKKGLTINDYSRWRGIEGAQISSDGKWAAYVLRYANTLPVDSKPVLHIHNLGNGHEGERPHASNPTFSPDGRWIVYQVDSMPNRGRPRVPTPGDTTTA